MQTASTLDEPRQVTFYDLINTLRKRKWLVFLCLLGVLTLVFCYNQISPPVYEAQTNIIFEEAKEPIPTFDLSGAFSRKSFITNQIEEIKSRTLSEQVVKTLPPQAIADFRVPNPLPPGLTSQEYITTIIQKSISALPVRDSDVIKIVVQSNTPANAMIIANTVTEVLGSRSLEVKREEISSVRQFIQDQMGSFQQQLQTAEQGLKEFKEKSKVTSLDQESAELLRRITEADILYNQAVAERGATEKRLAYVGEKFSEQRSQIVPSITDITSSWAKSLKGELVELEVERSKLLVQEFPEGHPTLTALDKNISEMKQTLTREVLKLANGGNILDPFSQMSSLLEQSISLEIDLETYKARENCLRGIIDSYDQRLQSLPEKELALARLLRAKQVNEKIYMMLLEKHEEARITEAGKISNIRVIDPAKTPRFPVKPRKMRNLILGIIVGATVGVGMAFFLESLDTSLKTIEDVEQYTGMPILGSIPRIKANTNTRKGKRSGRAGDEAGQVLAHLITHLEPKSAAGESYRGLRTSIQFASPDQPLKTLVVTSAGPQEGKTTTVTNLAISTAQLGTKTLLVDADLRRPMLHKLFAQEKEPGLTNVLAGQVQTKDVIHETEVENLYLITCGVLPPNPSELLSSQKMKALLRELAEEFDIILIDSPPIIAVTDAVVLGTEVDGVALVVQSGKTGREPVLRAKSLLDSVNAKTIGAVLNNVDVERLYGAYNYYYHYYYYYTAEGDKQKRKHKRK